MAAKIDWNGTRIQGTMEHVVLKIKTKKKIWLIRLNNMNDVVLMNINVKRYPGITQRDDVKM
jgi:hypothetical protein